MNDCIFCKIISGEVPAQKIYEDEKTLAFLDISPVNPGHTLVLPKTHAKNIFDISPEDWAAVAATVHTLAPVIRDITNADGINIHVNNESAAGQEVFHSHTHIIPRHEDDDLKHWQGKERITNEQLDEMQQNILAALQHATQ